MTDSVWVGGRQAGGEIEAAPELHGVGAEDDDETPGGRGCPLVTRSPGTSWSGSSKAVHNAEALSGLKFSVFVGVAEEDARAYAERLHGALEDPAHSVLVLCDPEFHALEIVTGSEARRWLDDVGVWAGRRHDADLVRGRRHRRRSGGRYPAAREAARHPRTLHTSKP